MGKHGPTPIYDIRIELQRESLALRESYGDNWKEAASNIEKIGRNLEKALGGLPLDRKPDDQLIKFLDGVVGCVEANSNERSNLWERNSKREDDRKKTWEENSSGLGVCVGIIGDFQVYISMTTAVIDGQKILFYDGTSRVVDHEMIRSWLKDCLPKTAFDGDKLNNTDAQNFHCVFRSKVAA